MRCSTRPPSAPLAEAGVVFPMTDGWSARNHRDYTAPAAVNSGACMSRRRAIAAFAIGAVLGLSPAFAHAGPCTAAIAQFEAAVRASAGNPMAGLAARPTNAAQNEPQPTVGSLGPGQERLQSHVAAYIAR